VPEKGGADAASAEALRHIDEPHERVPIEAGVHDRVSENLTTRFRYPALATDQGIRYALAPIRVRRPRVNGKDTRQIAWRR